MNRMITLRTLSPLMLMSALAIATSGQGHANAAGQPAPHAIPFRGVFTEKMAITRFAPPLAFGVVTATGHATMLDRSTAQVTTLGNVTTISQGIVAVTAHYTFTAASGDRIYMRGVGVEHFNRRMTQANISLAYTVTGGTGRFRGAAGAGIETAHETILSQRSGIASSRFDGVLTIPATKG